MVGFTFGTALVVGAVVSLATGSWWFLLLAIGVHATATLIVLGALASRLREEDKPDPVTEARVIEEGRDRDDERHLAV
jgi:membrane protein implicated in regulation of membrane protease activity